MHVYAPLFIFAAIMWIIWVADPVVMKVIHHDYNFKMRFPKVGYISLVVIALALVI